MIIDCLLVVATTIALSLLLMPILYACSQTIINQWATKQQLLNDRLMEQQLHIAEAKLAKEAELAQLVLNLYFENQEKGGASDGG